MADGLRLIAARLEQPPLAEVVRRPGIGDVYRVSIQYHDGRHPDQVATLTNAQQDEVLLRVVYRRFLDRPVLEYLLAVERFQAFDGALRRLHFDRHDDQPGMPAVGADLWLLERASGSFRHDIVIAPELADGIHRALVDAVRARLPEALRAMPPA
jgi:hypothetical protein